MMNCVIALNVCRGFIGLIGALMVVTGVIKTDGDYDNYGKTENKWGSFFFFGGWLLFAFSIGLLNGTATGFVFTLKGLFGVVSSVLVIIAAGQSQMVMYKQNEKLMRAFLIMFMFAWVCVAYSIAYSVMHPYSPDYLKLVIALVGAIGVIAGMIFQMKYRKRGFDFIKTGTPSDGNVYSPGLPLFTGGWMLLALANALI
ncbi:MAG: hypothetical protein WD055_01495 [Candidatus Dependentiae bacterium]